MTNHATAPPPPTARPSLPWLLILGLASLALLWPLTALTGIIGHGAPRAFLILGVTAVAWIAAVGFSGAPRPVLTLTLTGVFSGLIALVLAGFVLGGGGPFGDTTSLWGLIPALLMNAGFGALTGVAALGVQALVRGGRS